MAKNLAKSIGDFLIEEISPAVAGKPVRAARGKTFRGSHPCEIHIFDPHSRFDSLDADPCSLSPADLTPLTWADIVVSEYAGEDRHYDHTRREGTFEVFASSAHSHGFAVKVEANVRKPGKFALATIHAAARALDEMSASQPGKSFSLWDLGCGCGVVGLCLGREFRSCIAKILFTDIRDDAIQCTGRNLAGSHWPAAFFKTRKGKLFEPAKDEAYDLIVFNAPFLSNAVSRVTAPDFGGSNGIDTAIQFCENLRPHLRPGGHGILTIADYVDRGQIVQALHRAGFAPSEIRLRDQVILYPRDTQPAAAEINHQIQLEGEFGYKFEHCVLGSRHYLAFKIRVYDVKVPAAGGRPG